MDPQDFSSSAPGRVVRTHRGYWSFVPNPLPPDIVWGEELVAALSGADRALGELAGLGRTLPDPSLLVRPFARREAVLSSRIEGTQASLSDLYVYEATQLALFQPPLDVREVHNYVNALEYGLQRLDTLPVSLRLMRETHARLLEGVRGEHNTPGEFRKSQNWIGPPGSTLEQALFVPPSYEDMLEALVDLERYLHAPTILPPLVRLGLIHYQFEAIHPFLDGNGRIGRLLIALLLGAWGLMPRPLLYMSAYFEANREAYYDLLLRVSRQGAWDEWLLFFLRGVDSQARDGLHRAERLATLRERYRQQMQSERTAARLLRAVDLLFARPALTVRDVESALGVGFATARRYVRRLEESGILREITGRSRDRVYQADEVLAAIEAPQANQQ